MDDSAGTPRVLLGREAKILESRRLRTYDRRAYQDECGTKLAAVRLPWPSWTRKQHGTR